MAKSRKSVPACVYLLADHLDGALAAGEDLVRAGSFWPDGSGCDPATAGAQRWAITRIRTHELSLITRILQARAQATELAREANVFRGPSHLFCSSVNDLEGLVEDDGNVAPSAFDVGTDIVGFLRERGIIAADAAGAIPSEPLVIGDGYLLAGKMPLGVVLDLVSEFLDALDVQFDLYPDAEDGDDDGNMGRAA